MLGTGQGAMGEWSEETLRGGNAVPCLWPRASSLVPGART